MVFFFVRRFGILATSSMFVFFLIFYFSYQAIEQMQEIFQSNNANLMVDYEDDFMNAITIQFKNLQAHNPKTDDFVCRVYRHVLMIVDMVSELL